MKGVTIMPQIRHAAQSLIKENVVSRWRFFPLSLHSSVCSSASVKDNAMTLTPPTKLLSGLTLL